MSTNELSVFQAAGKPAISAEMLKQFDDIAGGGYLPSLRLFTSNSEECKEGKITPQTWCVTSGGDPEQLGQSVEFVSVAMRWKAVDMNEGLQSYNSEEQLFKDIQERADADSNSGNMYGPEFLIWLPIQKKFVTHLCGSKTARRQSKTLMGFTTNATPVVGGSKKFESKEFTWFGPTYAESSTPLASQPTAEEFKEQLDKFENPKTKEAEVVKAPETGSSRD